MRNAKAQVMSCGACSVSMGESGHMTTSVDMLAHGVKSLITKARKHNSNKLSA